MNAKNYSYYYKMEDINDEIVDLLTEVLGKSKKYYESRGQISFNCPECDEGRNKGNLEVNINLGVYKCWSCGDMNDMHGPLGKLFDRYGNKKQKKLYQVLKPEEVKKNEVKKVVVKLPEGYTKFSDSNPRFIPHREAYNYLINRGITDELIEKYNIGYCATGDHAYRVVVPSYNKNGVLNFYVARSWLPKTKAKYRNPEAPKDQIIFGEDKIDWSKDVYLCEGVFDSFFLPNPLVLLGKHLSDLAFQTIYEKAQGNLIICLDGDAWKDAQKIYNTLNGGRLSGKIKILKLPMDKDVAELKGSIEEYYYNMKY